MTDYDAMAASYADNPPTAEEAVSIEVRVPPYCLRCGSPQPVGHECGRDK